MNNLGNKLEYGDLIEFLLAFEKICEVASPGLRHYKMFELLQFIGKEFPYFLKYLASRDTTILREIQFCSLYTEGTLETKKDISKSHLIFERLFIDFPGLQGLAAYILGKIYLTKDIESNSRKDSYNSSRFRSIIFRSIREFQSTQWDTYELPDKKNISEAIRMFDIALSTSQFLPARLIGITEPEMLGKFLSVIDPAQLDQTALWNFLAVCIKLEFYGVPPYLTTRFEGLRHDTTFIDYIDNIIKGIRENPNLDCGAIKIQGKTLAEHLVKLKMKRSSISYNLTGKASQSNGKTGEKYRANVTKALELFFEKDRGVWDAIDKSDSLGDPCNTNPEVIELSGRIYALVSEIQRKSKLNTTPRPPSA